MSNPLRPIAIALTALVLIAPTLGAAELAPTIGFSSAAAAKMREYGETERATLASAIDTAVARETRKLHLAPGLTLQVTIVDVAPSHPTRAQMAANPAADPTRTHFLGGAELAGEVRDAGGHVVAAVSHRYFAPTLRLGSASLDPWADARLAIDQFAVKVASACRGLPQA